MVIRKLNELTDNYQKLQVSNEELTRNYISMKKDTETLNKPRGNEEYKFGTEEQSTRNQKQAR